jgi:hypothetical protein
MLDFNKILIDGGIMTAAFLATALMIAYFRPRLFLNKEDIPADILAAVPPKTEDEKRLAVWTSIPLFVILIGGTLYSTFTFYQQSGAGFVALYLHALIILVMISVSDLVLLDWLLLNTWTPKWVIFPGTEGFAGYKDKGFHGRAHLKALPLLLFGAAISAGLTLLIGFIL